MPIAVERLETTWVRRAALARRVAGRWLIGALGTATSPRVGVTQGVAPAADASPSSVTAAAQSEAVVSSPDGEVRIHVALNASRTPTYSVQYGGRSVLLPSPLGLEFRKGGLLSNDLRVVNVTRGSHDETYAVVAGATRRARNHYNEIRLTLRERAGAGRRLGLVFRAYDDGAAFRYEIPRQPAIDTFDIMAERTDFRFAENYRAWAPQYDSYTSSYETEYRPTTIDSITPVALVGLPVTLQAGDGTMMALTEADLTDYAGLYVSGVREAGTHGLTTKLSPLPNGNGVLVHATAPHASPWRVLMLGHRPGDLIESTLVMNLNPPSRVQNVSWIVPGKVLFPWWPDFRTDSGSPRYANTVAQQTFDAPTGAGNRINFVNQRYYVDFAAEYGIRYIELEPPWYGDEKQAIEKPLTLDITTAIPDLHLPELLAYAGRRDVYFLAWAHWESVRAQMEPAFAQYERWGIKGVKIDFMNRDDQEMVNWYHQVLESAARHHLVVYFHGAYKPTGMRRTWPNLLTTEAVMGLEYNKWSHRSTPEHNVTLPFTRMLVGPMDYTPGGFSNVTPPQFKESYSRPEVMTTRAQQLAMFVVYLSPLQMVADWPGAYRGQPAARFIRAVPTSWDETRVITGTIGEDVAIARRHGDAWFIGAMTNGSARDLRLPLAFLRTGRYRATIYADGPDAARQPTEVVVTTREVGRGDVLQARLAPGGGYAVQLTPVRLIETHAVPG